MLEQPYLDRLPEKKEAHFYPIVNISVGKDDPNGKALGFLDRGGKRRTPKMYLYYCTDFTIGKG